MNLYFKKGYIMLKIWTSSQVNLLEQVNSKLTINKIPNDVIDVIKFTVLTLDKNYGCERNPDKDLGGYICIMLDETIRESPDYCSLLSNYKLTDDMAELTDSIYVEDDITHTWFIQLFILSSDYALTIIYKDTK